MFCLRSWLPLLFIPTNASPAFIFLFFVCTYFLNRPCVYCSILLLILFTTSCNWSERCFFDFGSSDWFQPRSTTIITRFFRDGRSPGNAVYGLHDTEAVPGGEVMWEVVWQMVHGAASSLVDSEFKASAHSHREWTGLGLEWLRSLLGKREWMVECLNIKIRL